MTRMVATPEADPDWRTRAACRGEDPETWFPVGTSGPALIQLARARAVCARCPVRQVCLTDAMDNRIEHGVWGGLSEQERRYHPASEVARWMSGRHAGLPLRAGRRVIRPEVVEAVRRLAGSGMSDREVSDRLGGRLSQAAVYGLRHRHGIPTTVPRGRPR